MDRLMTTGGDKAERVMTAVLKMKKIDIAELERAYADPADIRTKETT
jgi:hypothetical protein